MVDYSKFKNIEDSDEEPVWQTKASQQYKGLPQKALSELDAGAERLKARSRPCLCFLDFAMDMSNLQCYQQEMKDAGAKIPESRHLGRVVIELDQAQHAPKLCENFRLLCTGERGTGVGGKRLSYKDRPLDFILPKYCVQASIPNEYSCWGRYLPDERLVLPTTSFEKPGLVAVGNHGADTNSCTFMIMLNEASHLDGFNQIIGRVVRGMEVLRLIEGLPTDRKTQSFSERNVKTHWGGKPMVDVVIESCGELADDKLAMAAPVDGDVFPEHAIDYSVKSDFEELMFAQEKIRDIGNVYFKKNEYKQALEKYKKAQSYLEPLLKKQHQQEFADEEASSMLAGGLRPKDRTDPVRADLTIKLNVCQVLLAMGEWRAAIATADGVVLELVGRHSKKGHGAYPNDNLVVKALFRRAKGRIGLSDVSGEVSQLDEAIEDLKQGLRVDPDNGELKRELDKARLRQREADERSHAVYQKMMSSGND
eukprot:TRINITY_DN92541_c0_g1_i1.p1 TRINITY_DN92541_c0_g1~~TRINITY_DN92541_c0_g1_i1.p1  ORF type:complete len:480 (+),score=114.13 TRINITY_DN92541_c0_g1_i1:78-1517(+)